MIRGFFSGFVAIFFQHVISQWGGNFHELWQEWSRSYFRTLPKCLWICVIVCRYDFRVQVEESKPRQ